ncbi:MAG: Hsp20/alpha crystallin family protein [Phycisphaerales bacterium]|nr:Hsp20/alpha crystallin family protein [Phycisphaerales bacterium]
MATATAIQEEQRREGAVRPAEPTRVGPVYSPYVDILERADELTLVADVPGVSPESIDIRYEQGELSIRARVEARQTKETRFLLREYGVGDYLRVFQLGEGIDNGKIHAEVADGVLTVHLPKVEKVKPRKITVRSA